MNGPFQVAQANTATQTSGKPPARIVKVTKPFGEQSVVVPLSYDGSVKADLSSIAGENITLVHIGEKLIILFDNKSTVTLEPFFDANGTPLNGLTVEVSPGRDLTGTEFAALFPVTEDRSILPAAGDGNGPGAQASGANFTSVNVDPLAAGNPIDLLGQEDLPNFTINALLRQNDFINGVPSARLTGVIALDEDAIPGINGNAGGDHDIDAPYTFSGKLNAAFGLDGPGTIVFGTDKQVINGITVTFIWNETTHTLTANDGHGDVFQVVVNPTTGDYTVTLLGPLHHHTDALAGNNETSDIFNLTYTVTDSNGTQATSTLSLEINDDTPVAHDSAPTDTPAGEGEGEEGGNGQIHLATIDDEGQANGNAGGDGDTAGETTSVSGKLDIAPGADGLKAVAFTGANGEPHVAVVGADGAAPQVIFVDPNTGIGTPETVTLVWQADVNGGGKLIGISEHFTAEHPAFTLTVDAEGNYTFDVSAPFVHPVTTDGEGSIGFEDNIQIEFSYTATDGDGDKASATLTFNIDDDTPTVAVTVERGNEGQQEHALLVSLDESIGGDRGPDGAPDGDRDLTSNTQPDPTGHDPIGKVSTAAGDRENPGGLESLFNVSIHAGADGIASAGGGKAIAYSYALSLTGGEGQGAGVATALKVTDPNHTYQDDTIYLVKVSDTEIVGYVGNHVNDAGDHDGAIAIRITLADANDLSGGKLVVEQYMPIDHGTDDNDFDSTQLLQLSGGASLGVTLTTTVTDGDGDKATDSATVVLANNDTSSIGFQDDGPAPLEISVANGAGNGLFFGGFTPNNDQWGAGSGINTTGEAEGWHIGPATLNGAANPQLERVGDGYRGADSPTDSVMVDMEATPGNLKLTQEISGLSAGTHHLTFEIGAASDAAAGSAVLKVYWNGDLVGTYELHSGVMQTISIDVTATGNSNQLTFEEVGTSGDNTGTFLANVKLGGLVIIDETKGIDPGSDDVATSDDIRALFASVELHGHVGSDPDMDGPQYAHGKDPVIVLGTPDYGTDGAGSVKVELGVSSSAPNGVDSGLMTTDGKEIYLFAENGLVVGRYDANGGDNHDTAAFALHIGADGTLSIVQYVSLHHPDTGSNDEGTYLKPGTVQAVVTVTDGDGDHATSSVDISGTVRFEDDGPTISGGQRDWTFDEDRLANGNDAFDNPQDADRFAVSDKPLGVHWGADGAKALTFVTTGEHLSTDAHPTITVTDDSGTAVSAPLSSGGVALTYVIASDGHGGEILTAYKGTDHSPSNVIFTLSLDPNGDPSGAFSFELKGPLDHPNGDGNDSKLNLSIGFTATDGDDDTASSTITIRITDDVPVVTSGGQRDWTLDEDVLSHGNDAFDNPADTNDYTAINDKPLGLSWGSDGAKALTLAASDAENPTIVITDKNGAPVPGGLTSGGVALTYEITPDGHGGETLTAYKGDHSPSNVIFTLSLDPNGDPSGAFSFELKGPLDHPTGEGENTLNLNFGFTATDGDGDTAPSSVTIRVTDDVPVVASNGANYITNGDFQAGNWSTPAWWGSTATNADGWSISGDPSLPPQNGIQFERQSDGFLGLHSSTHQGMIDMGGSPGNYDLTQQIGANGTPHLVNGQQYVLELEVGAPFPSTAKMEVWWNNTLIGVIDTTVSSGQMEKFAFIVTGSGNPATDQLTFKEVGEGTAPIDGTVNGEPLQGEGYHGTYIANVKMFALNGVVDEDALNNSQAHGVGDSQPGDGLDGTAIGGNVVVSGALGVKWGSDESDVNDVNDIQDGANSTLSGRSLTFTNASVAVLGVNSLTSNGEAVHFALVDNNTKLVGYVDNGDGHYGNGDRLVLDVTLSDDDSGSFKFTLHDNLDHAPGASENDIALQFNFTATDSDGDSATGTFAVGVDDDMPTIPATATQRAGVQDDALPGGHPEAGDSAVATGTLSHNFGADADGGHLSWLNPTLPTGGYTSTIDGNTIDIYQLQGTVTVKVFTVTLDPATGEYTVTQLAAVHHPNGNGEQGEGFDLNYRVTDGDGDYVDSFLRVVVGDDTPTIPATTTQRAGVQDDALPGGHPEAGDSAVATGTLSHNFGADADGGHLSWLNPTLPTGGYTSTIDGNTIDIYQLQGTVNVKVFTVTLDPATGDYTVTQLAAVHHPNGNGEQGEGFDLNYRVTDGDGDYVDSFLRVVVGDDTPTIPATTTQRAGVQDDALPGGHPEAGDSAVATGTLSHNFGADADGGHLSWLNPTLPTGGYTSTIDGNTIDIYQLQGTVNVKVFTVTLDPATGDYTVTQLAAVHHPNGNGEQGEGFDLNYRVTDGDGDYVDSFLRVVVGDDTPALVNGGAVSVSVNENDILTAWSVGTDANIFDAGPAKVTGTLAGAVKFGADGPGHGGFAFADKATVLAYMESLHLYSKETALPENGKELTYTLVGNVLTANEPGPQGNPVFTLTLNPDGSFEFRLYDELVHVAGGDTNTDLRSGDTGSISGINFGNIIVATDGDGDSVTLGDGFQIKIVDDVPEVSISRTLLGVVQHDETAGVQFLEDTNDASVRAVFNGVVNPGHDAGASGYAHSLFSLVNTTVRVGADAPAASQTLSLQLIDGSTGKPAANGFERDSGLTTTDHHKIILTKEGDLIVGRVDTDGDGHVSQTDVAAFAIHIDQDGGVSIAQYLSLHHPDTSSNDENVDLSGLIAAQVSVTDSDGDTATDYVNIGDKIRFGDDGPTAVNDGQKTVTEGASAISGNVMSNDTAGSDGATVTKVHVGGQDHAIAQDGSATTVTTSLGVYTFDDHGNWTFKPNDNLNNANGIDASFTYTLTDGDGDTDTAKQSIKITDGTGPSVSSAITVSLDEEALGNANATGTNPSSNAEQDSSHTLTFTSGSDNIKSIAFAAGTNGITANVDGINGNDIVWTRVDDTHLIGKIGGIDAIGVELTLPGLPGAGGNTGNVVVTATLLDNFPHPTGHDENTITISGIKVVATDTDGDTATGNITVTVKDDVPVAHDDVDSTTATPQTLTFDDVVLGDNAEAQVQSPYHGFNFINAGVYNPLGSAPYATYAPHSGDNIAFILEKDGVERPEYPDGKAGDPLTIQHADGSKFTALGAWFSSHGSDPLTITIKAYDANDVLIGTLVADIHQAANGGPTWIDMADLGSAHHITIDSPAGQYFGFDDFSYRDDAAVATGNVVTGVDGTTGDANTTDGAADNVGADGLRSVTWTGASAPDAGVSTIHGTYGTLTVDANGNYSYKLNADNPDVIHWTTGDATLADSFTYTITDGDGDTDTATLTISSTGADDGVGLFNLAAAIEGGEGTVYESGLPNGSSHDASLLTQTGTFNFTSPDGIRDLVIGTTKIVTDGAVTIGSPISTQYGEITITDVNLTTGVVSYSYTLTHNASHSGTDNLFDNISVTLTDRDHDTANNTLSIKIVDDAPSAVNYTGSHFAEGGVPHDIGDVATQLQINGGADGLKGGTLSSAVTFSTGDHGGTVAIDGNGHLIYTTPNQVSSATTVTETFSYTVTDGDGDTVTKQITFGVDDTGIVSVSAGNTVVDEDDLSTIGNHDSAAGDDATSASGHISYTLGADALKSVELSAATTGLTKLDGTAIHTMWDAGTHTLIGYGGNDTSDVVFKIVVSGENNTGANYDVTLVQPIQHSGHADPAHPDSTTSYEDNKDLTVTATVTDVDGSQKTANFTVSIDDDSPVIGAPDAGSTSEANVASATATAHGSLGIHFGADGAAAPAAPASGGTPHTINFDDAHNGSLPNNQYTHDGFTFQTNQGIANVSDHAGQLYGTVINVANGGQPFTITQMDLGLFGTTNSVLADNVRLTGIDAHTGQPIVVIFNVGALISLGGAATTFHAAGTAFDGISLSSLKIEPVLGWQDNNTHQFNGSVIVDNVVFSTGSAPLTHGAVSFTDLTTAINNVTIVDSDHNTVAAGALTSHGEAVHFALLDSMTLVGYTGDTAPTAIDGTNVVFSVVLSQDASHPNGTYDFALHQSLDNLSSGGSDLDLTFNFTAKDGDGDAVSGHFTVDVKDDVPTAGSVSLAVDEDDLSTGNADVQDGDNLANPSPTVIDGHLPFTAGADGLKSLTFETMTGTVQTTGGVAVTMNHLALAYVWVGNTLYATTDAGHPSDANSAFKVTITDASTGAYTFTLLHSVDHPLTDDSAAAPVKTAFEDNLDINLTFTVTDGDNDAKSTGTLAINIDDDVPVVASNGTNYITNGDFQAGQWSTPAWWGSSAGQNDVPGWSISGDPSFPPPNGIQFERPVDGYLGLHSSTGQGMIDMGGSPGNYDLTQQVGAGSAPDLVNGQQYVLQLEVGAPFPSTAKMEVLWNGVVIGVIDTNVSSGQMEKFAFIVTGHGDPSADTLSFREIGAGDAPISGTVLDDHGNPQPLQNEGYHGTYIANVQMFALNGVVDEDALNNPNAHGVGDSQPGDAPDGTAVAGNVTISGDLGVKWGADQYDVQDSNGVQDGANSTLTGRSLTFTNANVAVLGVNALTSDGEAISFVRIDNNTKLVGFVDSDHSGTYNAGDRLVLDVTLSDDGTGSFKFTLHDNLDHAPGASENDIALQFNFTATDSDGDSANGTFAVGVDDDLPVVTTLADAISVDEGNLPSDRNPTNTPGSIVGIAQSGFGSLHINWGADNGEAKHLAFAKDDHGNVIGPDLKSDGAKLLYEIHSPGDSPGNEQIVAYKEGDPNHSPVFAITLYESGNGGYAYVQYQHIDHNGEGTDTSQFNLNIIAYDADGDSVQQTLTINVKDDVPVAHNDTDSVSQASAQTLNFDDVVLGDNQETTLPSSYHGFNFNQTGVYNPQGSGPLFATYAPHSGDNLAFNSEKDGVEYGYPGTPGEPVTIQHTDGSKFTSLGAWFSSHGTDPLTITIKAYDANNVLIGTVVADIHQGASGGPTWIDLSSLGSAHHVTMESPAGQYFGFDDFSYRDDSAVATGNVITGTDGGLGATDANASDGNADSLGADGFGSITWASASASNAGVSTIAGQYGTLTVDANGNYSYKLNDNNPAVVHWTTGDVALTETFDYTIKDGDGDATTAKLTISVTGQDDGVGLFNLVPSVNGGDATVYESGLPAGSSHDASLLAQSGTFNFSTPDGIGDLTIGTTKIVTDGAVTIGSQISTQYGEITITGVNLTTGVVSYTYMLTHSTTDHGPLDNGANNVFDNVNVTLTDRNGDTAHDTLSIKVVDDVPSIAITAIDESNVQLTTHDANTIGSASDIAVSMANFGDVFHVTSAYGADGAGSTSLGYKLAISATPVNSHVDSGLDSHGQTIYLYELNGTIIGSTSSDGTAIDANKVFALTVDSNGVVTLTQYAQIDHPISHDPSATGAPFDDQTAVLGDNLISLTHSGSVTDGDGDTVTSSASVDLGGNIRFADDGPRVTAAADKVSVDEGNLPSDRNPEAHSPVGIAQSGFGSLNINWGADNGEAKHLAFAKDADGHVIGPDLKSDGVKLLYEIQFPSDTPGNEQIVAYKESDPNHNPVFAITLYESGNGGYSYVQYQSIDHTGTGTDTSQFDFNVIAYDADGDTVQQTVTIKVKDDVPWAEPVTASMGENDNLTVGLHPAAGDTHFGYGADGAAVTGALTLGAISVTGDYIPASLAGLDIKLVGTDIVIHPGTTFDPLGTGQSSVIHIQYQVTDGDGDTTSNELTVTVNGATDNQAPEVHHTDILVGVHDNGSGVQISIPVASLLWNIHDPEGDAVSFVANSLSGGDAHLDASGQNILFTVVKGSNGSTTSFSYSVTDGVNTTHETVDVTRHADPLSNYTTDGHDFFVNTETGNHVFTLNSAGGNDVIIGTRGGDGDDLSGGDGNDLIYGGASGGGVTAHGGNGDDTLYGGSSNTFNKLYGDVGNDHLYTGVGGSSTLVGGSGNDDLHVRTGATNVTLTGDGSGSTPGADHFVFEVNSFGTGTHITDFVSGQDSIDVLLQAFTGLSGTGTLTSGVDFFKVNDSQNDQVSHAGLIYSQSSGQLYYDSNGGWGDNRTLIAVLDNHEAIQATDIHKI